MDPGDLRASDADREQVADRLRIALDEGRLNLHEYDERLREAYGAKTYAELNALLADLPGSVPGSGTQVAPPASTGTAPAHDGDPAGHPATDGRYVGATRQWLLHRWEGWASAVTVCIAIWGVSSLLAGEWLYFWPGWVAGPWGAILLMGTVTGLMGGEPQQWMARRARRRAEREVRREARREIRHEARREVRREIRRRYRDR